MATEPSQASSSTSSASSSSPSSRKASKILGRNEFTIDSQDCPFSETIQRLWADMTIFNQMLKSGSMTKTALVTEQKKLTRLFQP